MAPVHVTEAELARDLAAVLEKVRQGAEVIVERDAEPVAVIKPPQFRGRPIDECIELLRANGSHAKLDTDFSKDPKTSSTVIAIRFTRLNGIDPGFKRSDRR